jgi:glucosyl-3-phosphoglycerate synthase
MITVIIPVRNESATIGSLIAYARQAPNVSEIIVVDDGSIDGTPELAIEAGALVVTSTMLGKGASMEDGMLAARNEVLMYLDGDLSGLAPDVIARMTEPILAGQADFTKAKFARKAGRVTILTAKPLLRLFFPELAHFEQPLGGVIAARKSLLRQLRFENDYGVDIGLLLDSAAAGAQIVEVDIGSLAHDSHPLEILGDMAAQVVRTLLDRAARYRRLTINQVREVEEVERHAQAEMEVVLQKVGRAQRLALFDMDGTLLKGRFILGLAQRLNKSAELAKYLDHPILPAEQRTQKIAQLFAGVPLEVFEEVARQMPLMPGANETVVALRKLGYRVGIVTDSYHIPAEIVRRRVFADFSISHLMRFSRGKATGQLTLTPAFSHPEGCTEHALCKRNALLHLLDKMDLSPDNVLAVGDGDNDCCMLEMAGLSVAFQPKTLAVQAAATHVLYGSLTELIELTQANALARCG